MSLTKKIFMLLTGIILVLALLLIIYVTVETPYINKNHEGIFVINTVGEDYGHLY